MLNKKDIIELIELERSADYHNLDEVVKVGDEIVDIQKSFHSRVDELFNEIANQFELKTGDVTPSQNNTIDEFEKVLFDYVYTNIKDNI